MSRLLWPATAVLIILSLLSSTPAQDAASQRVITGKRISSPTFQLEVLVDGRPLREYNSRGQTYVEALEGAEYEVRMRNSSPDRVAVALSVDGLSTIDARESSAWNASKWVIEPYQTITISGWQMNSEQARRFYFTDERDSYAARLGQRTDIGAISAVFFRERRPRIPITQSRPQPSARSKDGVADGTAPGAAREELAMRDDRAATGIGRSVRNDVCLIDMDLESRPAAELTIRYEWGRRPICGSNPRCRAGDKRDN